MSNPLDDMQARYDGEYKEMLGYAQERNWKWIWFDSPEDMMGWIELFSDEDSTIYEDWWRAGFLEAMEVVRKWYQAEE